MIYPRTQFARTEGEIVNKYIYIYMQNMPLMNWKKCNYVWNNIFTFAEKFIIYASAAN